MHSRDGRVRVALYVVANVCFSDDTPLFGSCPFIRTLLT